jgi:hypothetical protein
VHECTRPEEVWRAYNARRRQLFIADDAFGATEYRPEAAERWAVDLDLLLRRMDERHWLLWTSRPTPLKAALRRIHREHGVERWPQPAEVEVATEQLDIEEKATMLFRHAHAAQLPATARTVVQQHSVSIVENPHFTPERIRRFVARGLYERPEAEDEEQLERLIAAEIRDPTVAMATSLQALPPQHRALLVALLDVPPGPTAERDLAAAARRHLDGGIPRPLAELIEDLRDHFLRVLPPASVTWVHPSWRDLVIDTLARDGDARRGFLSRSGPEGLLLALSLGGGAAGERKLPLLRDDRDWDSIGDRLHTLLLDLDDDRARRLLDALVEAIAAIQDEATEQELQALSADALAVVSRSWARHRSLVSPPLLRSWFELGELVPKPPPPPALASRWRQLEPAEAPSITSVPDLVRFHEWLELAVVLAEFVPDLLPTGFPDYHIKEINGFIRRAQWLLEQNQPGPTTGLVVDTLRLIARVTPQTVPRARRVAHAHTPVEFIDEWHVLPSTEESPVTEHIVGRILRDLNDSSALRSGPSGVP